ncbi:unnamed protein product [Lymnaea stagnalis]|uniref:Putative E3 ubiquitin-protein ligase UBR7 n=1 Tax=Lymnaea stagnalis TaxID=6523 RepID=A0AAV2H324_LYMST
MAQENGNNFRRCGQIGDGEDDALSMVDVLNEQARLQADADAVLGGSDENNCTFPLGYLKRQALYACATCTPGGNAGICLACSYACHEGHELYELYTKRYFRCDCGNEKFGGNQCQLYKDKKELNSQNRYNQNFKGVYCSCARPYPDPEDSIEDEMIQCIICEDWHHGRHLNVQVPESDDFQEMICPGCMSKNSFLWAYNIPSNGTLVDKCDESSEQVFVESSSCEFGIKCELTSQEQTDDKALISENIVGVKRERTEEDSSENESDNLSKKAKLDGTAELSPSDTDIKGECILRDLQKRRVECPDQASFWQEGWRCKLCHCQKCLDMYKDRLIEFLIDETDTVQAYEEKGRSLANSTEEEVSEASVLAGMDRVQQIEVVRGFMDLKTELNEFLQGFARDSKVVTETDIREFFQRMDTRRKERLHLPQNNCR